MKLFNTTYINQFYFSYPQGLFAIIHSKHVSFVALYSPRDLGRINGTISNGGHPQRRLVPRQETSSLARFNSAYPARQSSWNFRRS